MLSDDERGRGVLTPADRAYLRGETEPASVQSERNTRARVRRRVTDALLDFEVLVRGLEERDREQVFEGLAEDGPAALDAMASAVALLYRGADDAGVDFERVLREGVNLAEAADDRAATVVFDVTYHARSPAGLREKLASDEALSLTELAYLQEHDAVGLDELAAHLEDGEPVDDGRVQAEVTDF